MSEIQDGLDGLVPQCSEWWRAHTGTRTRQDCVNSHKPSMLPPVMFRAVVPQHLSPTSSRVTQSAAPRSLPPFRPARPLGPAGLLLYLAVRLPWAGLRVPSAPPTARKAKTS